MDWRDTGILLHSRRHGETSAIIEVFTKAHGRHSGIVRGGTSRKIAPHLQPGAQLDLTWRARLEDHIGAFTVEPIRSRAAVAMAHRVSLAGLNAVTSLCAFCLPEREAMPALYAQTEFLLDLLDQPDAWPLAYLRWEQALLEDMGYGLDLSVCAATGDTEDLIYVSPKTGRAVSRTAAGVWADKLLPLPPCLQNEAKVTPTDIVTALRTTGHFFEHRIAPELAGKPLPPARAQLMDRLARWAG